MKKANVIKATLLAASLAPALSFAEISGSFDLASQYLWRGQQLFGGGEISGSLDYHHSSGLYAGVWTSSENSRSEYDTYGGFGGSAGDLSYDLSYIAYNYSGSFTGPSAMDTGNFQEAHVGGSYKGFGADAYIGVGKYGHDTAAGKAPDNNDNYYDLSYSLDKVSATVGYYDFDAKDADYGHLDLGYQLTDNVSFTVSKIVYQQKDNTYNDDLQFVASYSFKL